jgi:hypothetical protein
MPMMGVGEMRGPVAFHEVQPDTDGHRGGSLSIQLA